ncbi:hypothetical protein ACQUTF_20380 [Enterobacter cloacae]|uniref:hypothetical protein n=1 Tax=Enterobacter cloacae TaxID=550 RepID=UPI003D16A3EA
MPPFVIFLQSLIAVEQAQPGPRRNAAATQEQIHFCITFFKPSGPQLSVELLALEIVHFLLVTFPPLRFDLPQPRRQLPAFLRAQIMEIQQCHRFSGFR